MRTIAYVDGYNLYYGCLKGSPHLWLDVDRPVRGILHVQDPMSEVQRVKYFTAYIKARFAATAMLRQKHSKPISRRSGRPGEWTS